MNIQGCFIAAIGLAASAGVAYAGDPGDPGARQVTVDYIPFTIDTRGLPTVPVIFDVRSVEAIQDGGWYWTDLNQDGECAYIDSYIYIFEAGADRGSLGAWVADNDDNSFEDGTGNFDGSVHAYDSYLEQPLAAGNYVLAISTYSLSEQEARDGVNYTERGPYTIDMPNAEDWSRYDHGDYRIVAYENTPRGGSLFDVEGTIRVVPAPGAAALIGLIGLAAGRRRR